MSIMSDFLNWANDSSNSIAMEADDITGDAIGGASKMTGNDDDNGDISLDTSDILGTKEPDKPVDNEDENAAPADDTPEDNPDEENPDDGDGTGDDDNDMPNNDDMGGEQDDNTKEEEEPFAEDRKKKLKKQLIHFYDVVTDNIKLITNYAPNVTNDETIKTLGMINSNLTQCKDKIYTLLTEDYPTMKYHELLKNYVALNRIYDLTSKSLQIYFEKYNADEDKMKNKKLEKEKLNKDK